ncbi:cAMP-binding domain of CRP or a regulatory subunit of cAMP-dependent protein kinases [Chitinophaga eiseniae]|uniref:cAMP-binding domain of CRP or a regulatory subunit of cAMP-dependent protein kinases n=1 Tax=Chitinophaga eiseniae TaxID=634771 RepID=A0A1T4QRB4_9BACT|nr:Crp/Fnr family transcriptional regulator [Chitinophaga eiseniae]SKA06329.1 cAMP-binding domain of CRP or a regulatory subunit of cAMP-dependent protein kinases [Chitinophaga eiseniae]
MKMTTGYEPILQNVAKHIALSEGETTFFCSLLQERQYHKKEYLLREGGICNQLAFLTSGCVKSYLLDQKSNEHILTIAIADWWVADYQSLVFDTPSELFIEAVEPTTALLLTKPDREILFTRIPRFEQYFRILTERAFAVSQQRITDILSLPAAARYEQFLRRYQRIAASFSQQQIASFIGVTPAFFSRMLKSKRSS